MGGLVRSLGHRPLSGLVDGPTGSGWGGSSKRSEAFEAEIPVISPYLSIVFLLF